MHQQRHARLSARAALALPLLLSGKQMCNSSYKTIFCLRIWLFFFFFDQRLGQADMAEAASWPWWRLDLD